jgi:mRNA interferase RelE/StbE
MKRAARLRVPDRVADVIRHLHPAIKRKLRAALEKITADPLAGKALKQELAGLRSFRVGKFRIVYRLAAAGFVELVAFGPRERIYEETYRLLRR